MTFWLSNYYLAFKSLVSLLGPPVISTDLSKCVNVFLDAIDELTSSAPRSALVLCPLSAAENRGVPHNARFFIHGLDLTHKALDTTTPYAEQIYYSWTRSILPILKRSKLSKLISILAIYSGPAAVAEHAVRAAHAENVQRIATQNQIYYRY